LIVGAIIKELESHGPMIACSQEWLNQGRYDTNNTAWGRRYELYRDGTVYRRKVLFHKTQGYAYLRRQKWETLSTMIKDYPAWQDFRDAWSIMQQNLNREMVKVEQARKDK
jgi:hypothetical protein